MRRANTPRPPHTSTRSDTLPRIARSSGVVLAAISATVAMTAAAPAASAASTAGGFWHLDETSGSVAGDVSDNGNDGRIRGDVDLGLPGYLGTAYSFAADGSWIEVPTTDSLNPGAEDFSVLAWVKVDDAPGKGETYDIVRKGLAGTKGGEFKLEIVKNGLVRCTAKDSVRHRGAITGPRGDIADGRWHLVGCAREGSAWRVMVDGRTRSRDAGLGSISNTKSLSIGSKYGQQDAMPGLIDEVQLTIG